jgi:hypothetical protein
MKERFTDAEWETLVFAPVFANYVVANADGGPTDPRESKVLVEATAGGLDDEDELTREVCQALMLDFMAILARVREASGTRSPGDVIAEAGRLADRMNLSGSPTTYKQFIVDMGLATAKAALPKGRKVSPAKGQMVLILREALNLMPWSVGG